VLLFVVPRRVQTNNAVLLIAVLGHVVLDLYQNPISVLLIVLATRVLTMTAVLICRNVFLSLAILLMVVEPKNLVRMISLVLQLHVLTQNAVCRICRNVVLSLAILLMVVEP